MNHIAIDLGSRKSQVCIRDAQGRIVTEGSCETRELWAQLARQAPGHVVLETSSEAFAVADAARAAGHRVTVVPSILVRALGVGQRGVKTDVRDAQRLSEAAARVELPSVHVPSHEARALRQLNTSRETLIDARTKLVNHVRGFLRTLLHPAIRCIPETMPAKVREALGESLPMHIAAVLASIEALSTQIAQVDDELVRLAKADRVVRRLMTIPGVGPVTATRFVAAIDDPKRFQEAAAVTAYLGLTPGENSSGMTTRRTGITKAGPAAVRRALVQASWCLWRTRPNDPIVLWARRIADRRGRSIAIVALARKLARVMFAMWRDESTYVPDRAATTLPTGGSSDEMRAALRADAISSEV